MPRIPAFALACVLLLPLAATADEAPDIRAVVDAPGFETLATALDAAALSEALRADGPFTLLAPTDAAFARIPEAERKALLHPRNRDKLRRLLLRHVIEGRVTSVDLGLVPEVKTMGGDTLHRDVFEADGLFVRVDVACKNGIVHAIDRVLLGSAPIANPDDVKKMLEAVLDEAAPVYRKGDPGGAAAIYKKAFGELAAFPSLGAFHRARFENAAKMDGSAYDQAQGMRLAIEETLLDFDFEPYVESSLPEGFPDPGPVGDVVEKTYPRYRAARADGGRSFWTLFNHIKKNNIDMTAPVEMTMDDSSGRMRMRDMAFLYDIPTRGKAGQDGQVDVLDLEPVTVLSIGMRGSRNTSAIEIGRAAIEARLKEDGYERAGDWRVFGYNSPMVRRDRRFWEIQLPVRKVR